MLLIICQKDLDIRRLHILAVKNIFKIIRFILKNCKETFIQYCEKNRITYEPYLKEREFSAESGYVMMNELIKEGNLPTAVFAASDPIAIGAIRSLYEHGLKVPSDVSVMGFDDYQCCQLFDSAANYDSCTCRIYGRICGTFYLYNG